MDAPKAFISYSRTSVEHSARVLALSQRLMQDGVEVLLDQWDLKPGNDAYAFMERCVTDPTVTKVIIVSDQRYAEKADSRGGGVGAEALIMSPEIYRKVDQDKFGIVVTEEDDDGEAFVPTFMAGRIYFDFRERDREERDYDALIRWLHNKPLLIKPPIGKAPAHMDIRSAEASATSSAARRVEAYLRYPSRSGTNPIVEYGERLEAAFREVRPGTYDTPANADAPIITAIERLQPYVAEFRGLCEVAASTDASSDIVEAFCKVLEQVATTMFRSAELTQWSDYQFEAHRYACYEAFLSIISAFTSKALLLQSNQILSRAYYVETANEGRGPSTSSFSLFLPYSNAFDVWNRKQPRQFYSPIAAYLKASVQNVNRLFDQFQEADFVAYLRSKIRPEEDARGWIPWTAVYSVHRYKPFPFFARCESMAFLKQALPLFQADSVEDFTSAVKEIAGSTKIGSEWDRLPVELLSNLEYLGSKA